MLNAIANRAKWQSEPEYLSACLGFTVGFGTLFRFPYLSYSRGGLVIILIPYLIMMMLLGIPLLYMDIMIGQSLGFGPIQTIGRICPLLKGTGYMIVTITFIYSTYHNVFAAWSLHYFFSCFKSVLPWTVCPVNVTNCRSLGNKVADEYMKTGEDGGSIYYNYTHIYNLLTREDSSSQYYFNYEVARLSEGMEVSGSIHWEIFMYLLLAWVLVFLCLFKGVRVMGKVMYITTILPYILMTALFFRALTLPGAWNGILYYTFPAPGMLNDVYVWKQVCVHILYSLGLGGGVMITYASYSKRSNNVFAATLFISFISMITEVMAGFVAFAVFGFMAEQNGAEVRNIVTTGIDLVFVSFSEGLYLIPSGKVWLAMFYISVFLLVLGSQFGLVEVIVTSMMDWLSNKHKNPNLRMYIVAGISSISFLLGIPYLMQNGLYTFTFVDYYVSFFPTLFAIIFEAITACFVYGSWKLIITSQGVLRQSPPYFFFVMWRGLPLYILIAVVVVSIYADPLLAIGYDSYVFPMWTAFMGAFIGLIIVSIPINYAIYHLISMQLKDIRTNFKKIFWKSVSPNMEYLLPEWSRANYVELRSLPMSSASSHPQPPSSSADQEPFLRSRQDGENGPPPPQYSDMIFTKDETSIQVASSNV